MVTLETIYAQNYPDLEIIVVEDRPSENSLGAYCGRNGIKYAARKSQVEGWMNPAPLMNHGLLMSTKEIVIFQNAEVKHEQLDNLVNLVTPIVQAKIDQEPPVSTFACVQALKKDGSFDQWYCHAKFGERAGWMLPFCQAISRDVAMKVQGYEEEFCRGGCGFEDTLWVTLLRYIGVRLCCFPNTLCSHQYHEPYNGDQRNGNEDIYKRIKWEVEVGNRPPVANWNKPWGNL
jgi:hypothetical protein